MANAPLKLWYRSPSGSNWNNALPLGTGRLGAMVFGNIVSERVALNEDSLWNGGPRDRVNPDAHRYIRDIQRLIREGNLSAAQELIADALPGIPDSMRCYEPLGDLLLDFKHKGYSRSLSTEELANAASCASGSDLPSDVSGYQRELDLRTAIAGVQYRLAGITYRREYIASAADGVIAIRFETDTPGNISFHMRIERGPRESYSTRYADITRPVTTADSAPAMLMTGKAGGEDGVSFAACLQASAEGGTIKTIGETIIVENADAVTIVLSASTSFREKSPAEDSQQRAQKALALGWSKLRANHIAEYQALFNRVDLSLCDAQSAAHKIPTDELLTQVHNGKLDPHLAEIYFQFGRYLLIASSRPGSLPATLQGIWNQDYWPAWGSKYTININTEMNYWPVELGALPECHTPLFDMLARVAESGRHTAKAMYGCRGFVCHHNTDIWADTCPTDRNLVASYWPMGGAWLSIHLWDHYDFNRNINFLKKTAYPILKAACEFFLDFLIEDSQGRLVVSPSSSPENVYRLPNGQAAATCMGATMDSAILSVLFRSTLRAGKILSSQAYYIDEDFTKTLSAALARLPRPAIGKHGQLMEWAEDYEETDLQHRHASHLFTLHPGDLVHPRHTPDLAQAARVTLKRRGDEGTGWSIAWKINFWARLHEGQRALDLLKNLLNPVAAMEATGLDIKYSGGGGSYNNLFCAHPPFQIDGNFGGASAIGEMLLQSHMTAPAASGEIVPEIELLPALPPDWASGSVSGLCARGGFVINLTWLNGRPANTHVTATVGGTAIIRYGENTQEITLAQGESKQIQI